MSGGFGLPVLNLQGGLASLGEAFDKGLQDQQRKELVQGLGVGPGDPSFLAKLGQAYIGQGDVNGALAISRLLQADQDRAYQRQTDARDFAFRQTESSRAQANADRTFSAGRQDAAADRTRQTGLDKLTEYYRDKGDRRADAQLSLQQAQANRKEYPEGFQPDPENPNALRPIPGGRADPAYIGRVKSAENDAKGGMSVNPYSSGDAKFNGDQGKSAGFADRMFENEGLIRPLETVGTSRFEQGLEGKYVPAFVGSYAHSDDFKSYKTAKDNWIAAQLRKESGAAIGQGEYDAADKQYFPQPGDSARQIEEKRQRRRIATEGMAREGGPSYVPRFTFGQDGGLAPYAPPERRGQPNAPAPAPASTAPQARMVPLTQVQEGQRFRRDGRVFRRVNGQDVPE